MRKQLTLLFGVVALGGVSIAAAVDAPVPKLRQVAAAIARLGGTPTQLELQEYVDAALAREPRDAAWGRDAEARLKPQLEKALPQGSALRGFECRDSMCRVETTHRDRESYDAFVRALVWNNGQPVLWESGATLLEPRAVTAPSGPGGLVSVGYLLRAGHTLPVPLALEGASAG